MYGFGFGLGPSLGTSAVGIVQVGAGTIPAIQHDELGKPVLCTWGPCWALGPILVPHTVSGLPAYALWAHLVDSVMVVGVGLLVL